MPDIAARLDTTRPSFRSDLAMTASITPAAPKSLDDIPGPKGVPVLGNMFEIKQATLIQDLMQLTREWGAIFKLSTPTGPRYVVSGLEMVNDLCDDARFDKLVGLSQREFRKMHKSAGLFTADTDDPMWKSAHDILLPSFSTWAMKGYLDPMIDIAEQLSVKWERLNSDEPIDVVADMTRLTLDTIALCGFGYRFNLRVIVHGAPLAARVSHRQAPIRAPTPPPACSSSSPASSRWPFPALPTVSYSTRRRNRAKSSDLRAKRQKTSFQEFTKKIGSSCPRPV
jgi:cytochrome P450